jgi:hypothetical protein
MGCENEVLNVARSPDGRHSAFVYRRDCGATTGFSTQVSLEAGVGPLPAEPGNVLVLGDEPVSVRWLGAGRLLIAYPRGARAAFQERERDGVRIEYREVGGR